MKATDPRKAPEDAKTTGPGKRSSETMQASDSHFVALTEYQLAKSLDVWNIKDVPAATAEDDMIQHFKTCNKSLTDMQAKLTSKLNNLKRRKQTPGDADGLAAHQSMVAALEDLRHTMTAFVNIYGELASASLNAGELQRHLATAMDAGYKFAAGVSFRFVKALCLDTLRFGQYAEALLH